MLDIGEAITRLHAASSGLCVWPAPIGWSFDFIPPLRPIMKKYLALAAVLAIAACGKKEQATPAADSTTAAPAADSTMARDTTYKM